MSKISTFAVKAAGAALLAAAATSASAVQTLVLTSEPAQTIGPQSASNPCIIAGTTCQNGTFAYTNFVQSGNISSYTNLESPTYTVSDLLSLFNSTVLWVAIDVNTTQAAGETLNKFVAQTNTGSGFSDFAVYSPTGGNIGSISGNGNGYADWTLRSLDLAGLAGSTQIKFITSFSGASDGAESFFLVNGCPAGTSCVPQIPRVPEPSTWALMIAGLGLFGFMARRRAKS